MTDRLPAQRWTYDVTRALVRLAGVALFQVRCGGRRFVPPSGAALVCANHQSFLDPMLVGLACNRRLTYLARESLFRWAPFGRLIAWYGTIPIQNQGLGIGGVKATLRRLKQGHAVLIFPEGTRSSDGLIGQLQPGICALARRGQAPLVPVGIDGAFEAWPRTRRLPRPHVIHLRFGEPISTELVRQLDDDQLIGELDQRIRTCHALAQRGRRRAQGRRETREHALPQIGKRAKVTTCSTG